MVCLCQFTSASSLFQFFIFILLIFLAELSAAILAFIFRENVSIPCGQAPRLPPRKDFFFLPFMSWWSFVFAAALKVVGKGAGTLLQLGLQVWRPYLHGSSSRSLKTLLRGEHGVVCGAALLRGVLREPLGFCTSRTHTHAETALQTPKRAPRQSENTVPAEQPAAACSLFPPSLWEAGRRYKKQSDSLRILPLPRNRGTREDKLSHKIRSQWLL